MKLIHVSLGYQFLRLLLELSGLPTNGAPAASDLLKWCLLPTELHHVPPA